MRYIIRTDRIHGEEIAIHCMMRNKTTPPTIMRLPRIGCQSASQLTNPIAMRNTAMKLPMKTMIPQLNMKKRYNCSISWIMMGLAP